MASEEKKIRNLEQALSDGLLNGVKKLLRKQADEDRKFNILRVLGIEELEIRHSFMLKWLLSPTGDHQLEDTFLKLFLKSYVEEVQDKNAKKHPDRYKALQTIIDYASFEVDREVQNIDLLLASEKEKIVIAIENKWNAVERVDIENKRGQLADYSDWISERYPDWNHYFIFLTPDKRLPSERNVDKWDALGYESVRRSLEQILMDPRIASETSRERQERRILIEHYYRIVERKLNMEGKDIIEMCTQIYDQYRGALDLLFKRADRRDPILRRLEEVQVAGGESLHVEISEATSYAQYKRRLPSKKSNSVHYEILAGEKECKVLLHIEKGTDSKIKRGLLEAVLAKCSEVADVAPISRRSRKDSDDPNLLGGAEIRIPRRGRSDADVENDIRKALCRIYEVFESILQGFEKRKK